MEVALVTGASSGIGRAVAERLVARGFLVLGLARRFGEEQFAHPRFVEVVCDLTDLNGLIGTARGLLETYRRLDLLVNNAGVGFFGPHETLSPAQLEEMVKTNLLAPLVLTRETLRHLRERKGAIINIASTSAISPHRFGGAYAATKAGLLQFSRSLFEEVRKSGVRVVTLLPDMTRTAFYEDADFEPDADPACHLTPGCIADALISTLDQRPGTVITEIVLKPERVKVQRKRSLRERQRP